MNLVLHADGLVLSASDAARRASGETAAILGVVGVAVVLVAGAILVALRRPAGHRSDRPASPELRRPAAAWLLATLAGGGLFFHAGMSRAVREATPVEGAMEIVLDLRGEAMEMRFPDGLVDTRDWMLPRDVDLTLIVRSDGRTGRVVAPELGIDTKLVAGREVLVPLRVNEGDRVRLFDDHGLERSIRVVSLAELDARRSGGPRNPYCPEGTCTEEQSARWGKDLFEQNGCTGCHSRDGARLVGPTFRGLIGRRESLITGEEAVVDRTYLAESIRSPSAKVVRGYNPVMPTFSFNDRQIDAVLAYAKTLGDPTP